MAWGGWLFGRLGFFNNERLVIAVDGLYFSFLMALWQLQPTGSVTV